MKLRHALLVGLFSSVAFVDAAPLPASVPAEIGDDGSLIIEGVHYTDAAPLKVELERLKKRHVNISLLVKQGDGHTLRFEVIGKAILLLQKAGVPKVGFIIGPKVH